jgi:hypothetical protein
MPFILQSEKTIKDFCMHISADSYSEILHTYGNIFLSDLEVTITFSASGEYLIALEIMNYEMPEVILLQVNMKEISDTRSIVCPLTDV